MSKCIELSCGKRAGFNYEGETKALYCVSHKKETMVDVKEKRCIYPGGCKTQATYNIEGETKKLYCSTHKLEGMVNVKTKTCHFPGCKTQPIYNYEGQPKGLYCAVHKKETMVNVKDKRCNFLGCKTIPHFNIEGQTKGLYCIVHKKEGMVNVRHKRCEFSGCKTQPIYNYEGKTNGLYCMVHKKENMVNVLNKTCNFPGCKTIPIYNREGQNNGLYCSKHKEPGMVNVKDKKCVIPFCETLGNKKYEGYCLRCFIHTFPDKPTANNYKTKEKAVTDFVLEQIPEVDWIPDKRVMDGCSKRRPDLLTDLGDQVVIVEVDENQHEDYDCSCENKRLMEISQDLGHRPLIMIRFNPDSYTDKEGKKVKSCWKVSKSGICGVDSNKKWKDRLNVLRETIRYWIENKTDKTVEVVHLFYDENNIIDTSEDSVCSSPSSTES